MHADDASGFAADDGSPDPDVVEALTGVGAGGPVAAALGALSRSRVLVPVVATPGGVEYDEHGRARDTGAEMSAVLMTGRDGRRALLAFTCLDALRAWQPDARPVPVRTPDAAAAALDEGADALLVDVAGPVMLPIEGEDLRHVAAGHQLVRTGAGYAWAAAAPHEEGQLPRV